MPQITSSSVPQLYDVSASRGMLNTIELNPQNVRFLTQNPDETVFIKVRPHPFVNIGWLMNGVFMSVIPVGIYFLMMAFNFDITDWVPPYVILVITLAFYSIIFSDMIFNFFDWYYDIYLITNQRMINIQFEPLKRYRISEAKLSNIEHIEERVIGFFPSIFNYGDVEITTAADKRAGFIFRAVPNPTWFRDVATDLSEVIKGGNND